MIEADALLKDLQGELGRLVDDLGERVTADDEVRARMEGEWRHAFDANRTGRTFEDWSEDRLTQVAVGWLLACVFVRFCEDNGLIDDARIAGPGLRSREARDAQQRFFVEHPHSNDREYLQDVFRSAAELRGLDGVLGEGESPLWLVDPPADAATRLLALFRKADEGGELTHDFTDPELSTRFLGDLYQDLSEFAKDTYALLQTPDFVEEFILDRTLTPAIETFGLAKTTLIDPTCGSGHFLLGAFHRLFDAWRLAEPGVSEREHAERALGAVTGVDLNPFAAAIARFRLLVAAVKASGIGRLADAPVFAIEVAVGDSLLWGARPGQLSGMESALSRPDHQFLYRTEDAATLRGIFDRRYAAVAGNPPYIVARDSALNLEYRQRYPEACSGKYSLAAPFMQCLFDLATSDDTASTPAGHVGIIVADSFMRREFGKKLVEKLIPTWDLSHVVDTSRASIPGHGTPTVILFGRHRLPTTPQVRTVMSIRRDSSVPDDPSTGGAWLAIVNQIDHAGSESDFVSVADVDRERFRSHPWSIGGGGAAELKEQIDSTSVAPLRSVIESIGIASVTGEDDLYLLGSDIARRRLRVPPGPTLVQGDSVRDWSMARGTSVIWPYDATFSVVPVEDLSGATKLFWACRSSISSRRRFGTPMVDRGLTWWEWQELYDSKLRTPFSVTFAFKASHNHFVLDRGRHLYNRTAPVIKLSGASSDRDYLALAGLLNSSVANFWVRQVSQPYEAPEAWAARYERDARKLERFPLPAGPAPREVAERIDQLATELSLSEPAHIVDLGVPTEGALREGRVESERLFGEMVALQEELDWECLFLYGLTKESLTVPEGAEVPSLQLGERAFEIILARKVAAGEVETAWFERHRSTPITELPGHWPGWYRELVERRIELIETDRDVGLVERPEHKRRWAREPWEKLEERALRGWLADRLEDRRLWFDGSGDLERAVCLSVAQLADRVVGSDPDFLEVARVWKGVVEVDPVAIVQELVVDEHVPAQAAARYKAKGFDKRRQWERTWDLQRMEDRGEALPDGLDRIPVPPKYAPGDFAKPSFWKQRGKLDVPKERFTSVFGAKRDADPSMVLAWAGFDHAEMAQAIGSLLVERQQQDGWDPDRSWPLVVAMAELLPWLEQWHNQIDPRWGDSPAGLYRGITEQQALAGGRTLADAPDWRPPAPTRGRKKKATAEATS